MSSSIVFLLSSCLCLLSVVCDANNVVNVKNNLRVRWSVHHKKSKKPKHRQVYFSRNTVNTDVLAAPFCSKFSDEIGDAAYLREHLDTMP